MLLPHLVEKVQRKLGFFCKYGIIKRGDKKLNREQKERSHTQRYA